MTALTPDEQLLVSTVLSAFPRPRWAWSLDVMRWAFSALGSYQTMLVKEKLWYIIANLVSKKVGGINFLLKCDFDLNKISTQLSSFHSQVFFFSMDVNIQAQLVSSQIFNLK